MTTAQVMVWHIIVWTVLGLLLFFFYWLAWCRTLSPMLSPMQRWGKRREQRCSTHLERWFCSFGEKTTNKGTAKMTYLVTKTYDHNEGLSVAFRQWRAKSHCRFIHGYSLAFEFTFASENLDELNWVLDFGSLKPLRAWLHEVFDHRLIVARDDPEYCMFEQLHDREIANVLFVNNVSCECFAEMAFNGAIPLIDYSKGIYIDSVTVSEHSGNSATFYPSK